MIYANGAPVSQIEQGTAFFHNFPPGKYRFTVQPFGTPTREHDTLQLVPGTHAYVQIQWEANWEANRTGGGSSFTVLTSSPEVAQQYLPTLTISASANPPGCARVDQQRLTPVLSAGSCRARPGKVQSNTSVAPHGPP
jgi:hypothetical protein